MKVLFRDSPYHGQRQFQKPVWIYPAHLSMFATHLRDQGHEVDWGLPEDVAVDEDDYDRIITDDLNIEVNFEDLPIPDRVFTNSLNPKYFKYGNYKRSRGTHYLSSNLCWWAGAKGCTFCVDSKRIMEGEHRGVRTVSHVMSEIEDCVRLGHNEAFDDAGTIPINDWLKNFCNAMIDSGLNEKIMVGCNLKPIKQDFQLMKKAGFRFVLVGVESANQSTLDRIQKGQRADNVVRIFKEMSDAGLEPHLTSMFGYDFESHEDNMRTVNLIHFLMKKGYVKTAQASVYMPPRTAPPTDHPAQKYVQQVYDVYKQPWYWWKKVQSIKDINDLTYILKRVNHLWAAK